MNLFKNLFRNQININFIKTSTLKKNQKINNNNNDKSLVIIFGWLNGSEKNVNKYVDDWNNNGYNKILISYYPLIDMVIPPIMTPKSLLILDRINDIIKENPKIDNIIFHVLSNGGAHYYSRTLYFIENNEKYKHLHKYIKGSLLDSNPSTDIGGIKYAFSIVAPNNLIKFVLMKTFPFVSILLSRDFKYFKSIYSSKNNWNHLFIYSKDDKIINYKHVDSTINNLKKNLNNQNLIDSICFDSSVHVFHRKIHKEQYYYKFNSFINKIK